METQYVMSEAQWADPALGRGCGGLSTKRHLLTDALGRPVRALLTAGQVHDRAPAEQLLADLRPACLVADRGYDARAWRAHLAARGTLAVIPAQRKRGDTAYIPARYGHDFTCYRQRNATERTFAKLKQFRRFATRYDKRADCFLAWFQVGAILIWLKTVHTPQTLKRRRR